MKDYPIGKRMFLTFCSIFALFCVTVVVAIISLFQIGGKFDNFYQESYKITSKAESLITNIQAVSKYIGYSMMENDDQKTSEYIQNAEDSIQELRDGTEYLLNNFNGDMSLVEKFDSVMKEAKEDRDKVFELAKQNKNQEAINLYFDKVMPKFLEARQYLEDISSSAAEKADFNYNTAKKQITLVTIVLIILAVVILAVIVVLATYITKSITKPILEIEQVAKNMAEGSLDVTIGYQSMDEIGSMAESIRKLTGNIRSIIVDIGRILSELADGNFHVTSHCLEKYVADYIPILKSMRLLRDNLNNALIQISEASQQVASGSTQMAQSAQGLAEGATEQAGAVEELTATIEDVANMAENSAQNAKETYLQIKTSAEKAEGGKKEMNDLIHAMERISATSQQIENIIAAIEDIASQTNLLSLNASIEAARAGEAGKGFAVVADQIGKLASDSAQSALDTKELIGKTLEEINAGNVMTSRTSETFKEVIADMKKYADITKDISESSLGQFDSLNQIRTGIEQISTVVQNNSAVAEETSATSEELSAQADSLDAQVGKFQLIQ